MPWHHVWHHADYIQAVVGVIGGAATVGAVLYAYKLGRKATVDSAKRDLASTLLALADEYLERQRDLDEHGKDAATLPTRRDPLARARWGTVAGRVGQVTDRVSSLVDDVHQLFGTEYAIRYYEEWEQVLRSPGDHSIESQRMAKGIGMLARMVSGWATGFPAHYKHTAFIRKSDQPNALPPTPTTNPSG